MQENRLDAQVLIVGAGIGGLTTAARLQELSISVHVVERAPELRAAGAGIMLHPNALVHLRHLAPALSNNGAVIESQVLIDADGSTTVLNWRDVWGDDRLPLAIHRRRLAELMFQHLSCNTVVWGTTPEDLAEDSDGVWVRFAGGTRRRYALVVGADGVNSWTREIVAPALVPRDLGQTFWRTTIAARPPFDFPEWRIWRARGQFFGAMPIGCGRVHVFLQSGAPAASRATTRKRLEEMTRLAHAMGGQVSQLMSGLSLDDELHVQRAVEFSAARWVRGRVAILGDAAHSVSPATTQGGALAIEDAAALANEIARHGANPAALVSFEARRLPRVATFSRLSRLHVRLMESLNAGRRYTASPLRGRAAIWYRRLYGPLMEPI